MNTDKLSAGDWFFGVVLHMGASWQTTLSGVISEIGLIGSLIAGLPSVLAQAGVQIQPHTKLAIAFVIIKIIASFWNSTAQKAKNVTGGSQQQTLTGNLVEPGQRNLVDATLKATPSDEAIRVGVPLSVINSVKNNKL
jgi:hypothetical protein